MVPKQERRLVVRGRAEAARQLQTLFSLGTSAGLADGDLLERFISRQGAVAEAAFAALIERHGSMVLRVCREILKNPADAEDAFQAVFLVLVRRARSIRNRESVASWLYGVALRVAGQARLAVARRCVHEQKAARRMMEPLARSHDALGPVLHEEVGRLPEKYRAAVVLCYWEGLTHEQAALRLRWPVGTVRSRLAWARQRLRRRLIRRGLAPVAALAAMELSESALAVPEVLLESTVQNALQLAAGQAPGLVSAAASTLTAGVFRTMMLARWKAAAIAVLTAGITAAGAGGLALQEGDEPQAAATTRGNGQSSKVVRPGRESPIERQIGRLRAYSEELAKGIRARENEWIELAQDATVNLRDPPGAPPPVMPQRIQVDEYRRVREQLFQINLRLIETESLLEDRQAEVEARRAEVGVEVATLLRELEQVERRLDRADERTRLRSDPKLGQERRPFDRMKEDVHDLIARWKDAQAAGFSRPGESTATLQELKAQIDAMKARKSSYERLLGPLQATIRNGMSGALKLFLTREDLATLREERAAVEKRIEQLIDEARAARSR
jgi:RNA polymerase sigma factor (sigma-70 family)